MVDFIPGIRPGESTAAIYTNYFNKINYYWCIIFDFLFV